MYFHHVIWLWLHKNLWCFCSFQSWRLSGCRALSAWRKWSHFMTFHCIFQRKYVRNYHLFPSTLVIKNNTWENVAVLKGQSDYINQAILKLVLYLEANMKQWKTEWKPSKKQFFLSYKKLHVQHEGQRISCNSWAGTYSLITDSDPSFISLP